MRLSDAENISGIENSASVYAARRDRLRTLLRMRGLDALLVLRAPNRFYLSGFELHDPQPGESAGMLIITSSGPDWLATDSRYMLAAQALWDKPHILVYGSRMAEEIGALCARVSLLAGMEARGASWEFAEKLRAALPNGHAILPVDGLVEKLRVIKDEHEQKALDASFALNHKMFDWLKKNRIDSSSKEFSEQDLAWAVERFFRENGAQELAFATIAAAGKAGAMPHAVPGAAKVEANSPVLVDAGCRVDNYCSDQTRSWWRGPTPSAEFERALALVREAQKAAMDLIAPGVACKAVYSAAWKVFEKAGVEKAFTHGLGHGVGLETHEAPRLSSGSAEILRPGMAVTVEPGLYYPEWGGVRWENTVLVTDDGNRIL